MTKSIQSKIGSFGITNATLFSENGDVSILMTRCFYETTAIRNYAMHNLAIPSKVEYVTLHADEVAQLKSLFTEE